MTNLHENRKTNNRSHILAGHCYCGGVQYEVDTSKGKPLWPPSYCHCDSCRRAHSAPLYSVVSINQNTQWNLLQGQELLQSFCRPATSATKEGPTRVFCKVCGSKIMNEWDESKTPWLPQGTKMMVFFPDTLRPEDRSKLPPSYQVKRHNCPEESVLDMKLMSQLDNH